MGSARRLGPMWPAKRRSKRMGRNSPRNPRKSLPKGRRPPDGEGSKDRSSMRYRKQRRGGKGLRDIRTSDRNGLVVGVAAVRQGDDIMLITTQGMVNRTHVNEIRVVGRNTQGVRIMNLNEGDKIASIAKVAKENGEEPPVTAPEPAGESPESSAPEAPPPANESGPPTHS